MSHFILPILMLGVISHGVEHVAISFQSEPGLEAAHFDEHWQRMRSSCTSLRYEAIGTVIIPKDAYKNEKDNPLTEDQSYSIRQLGLFDFGRRRFRLEISDQVLSRNQKTQFKPEHDIMTYASGDLRFGHLAVTANRGGLYSPRQPEFCFQTNNYPILTLDRMAPLLANGYFGLGLVGGDRQEIAPVQSKYFDFKSRAQLDGKDCFLLRSKGEGVGVNDSLELWVEAGTGMIWRALRFEGPVAESTLDLIYRTDGTVGQSLVGWRYTGMHPAFPEQPVRFHSLSVSSLDKNPSVSDADFTMEPKQGMVVRDQRQMKTYVLGKDGAEVPLEIALQQRGRGSYSYLLWGSVLIVAAVAALAGWRFWRKSQT